MRLFKFFYNKYRNLRSRIVLLHFRLIYGDNFQFDKGLYVRKGFTITIEENGHIQIGKNVFFNNFCSLNSLEEIVIGNNCIFGENVHIYDHNHIYVNSEIAINSQGFNKEKVVIGENCWIGSNVTILKGVTIGEHSVIGTGCLVYRDIEPNTIVINKQSLYTKSIEG